MKRMVIAVLTVLSIAGTTAAQSVENASPKTLLGFLKVDQQVGIRSVEGTSSVTFTTYSEKNFALAKMLAKESGSSLRSAESMAETIPEVRKELDAYTSSLKSPETQNRIMISVYRTTFGRISLIGDDYVVITLDGEKKLQRVIPKSKIGCINLDANPIHFLTLSNRSR